MSAGPTGAEVKCGEAAEGGIGPGAAAADTGADDSANNGSKEADAIGAKSGSGPAGPDGPGPGVGGGVTG